MDEPIGLLMAEVPMFNALDVSDADILEKHLLVRSFQPDETLYKEGEHANSVCFLVKGELKATKNDNGKPVEVATLVKGQSVGEMAIIDGLKRSATITASQPSTVLILKRDVFESLIKEHPNIGITILKEIARILSMSLRKTSTGYTQAMLSLG